MNSPRRVVAHCLRAVWTLAFAVLATLGAAALTSGRAAAQPGQTAPNQGQACSPCYLTLPAGYAPLPMITNDDLELLDKGEISGLRHFSGALSAFYLGFGSGQALQGRWAEKGWIFTVGETLSLGAMIAGTAMPRLEACAVSTPQQEGDAFDTHCHSSMSRRGAWLMIGGLIGFSVMRTWGFVDAIVGPYERNRRVRSLRALYGVAAAKPKLAPYLVPADRGAGVTAGLVARF